MQNKKLKKWMIINRIQGTLSLSVHIKKVFQNNNTEDGINIIFKLIF